MKKIPANLGWGGSNEEQLKDLLHAVVDSFTSLKAQVDDLQAKFNAHTHNADGAQAGAYYTSAPRSDAATVTAGTALTSELTSTVSIEK